MSDTGHSPWRFYTFGVQASYSFGLKNSIRGPGAPRAGHKDHGDNLHSCMSNRFAPMCAPRAKLKPIHAADRRSFDLLRFLFVRQLHTRIALNRVDFELVDGVRDVVVLEKRFRGIIFDPPVCPAERNGRIARPLGEPCARKRPASGDGGQRASPSTATVLWHRDRTASARCAFVWKTSSDMSDFRHLR